MTERKCKRDCPAKSNEVVKNTFKMHLGNKFVQRNTVLKCLDRYNERYSTDIEYKYAK